MSERWVTIMTPINTSNSVSGSSASAPQPRLTQEQVAEKLAASFYISQKEAEVYLQTRKAYAEETGVDFGSSSLLRSNTVQVLAGLSRVGDRTIENYGSVVNYLQMRAEEFNSRDEAWVRQTYSLTDSSKDRAFASKMAEDYRHLAAFTLKLADAMPAAEENELALRILSTEAPSTAQKPLTQNQTAQKMADSYHISKQVADTYLETLKAYKEETGADFSNGPLKITSVQLFGKLALAPIESGTATGLLGNYRPPAYNPTVNGKPVNFPRPTVPEPKIVSIIDHLQKELEEISRRNEAWVRKTYAFLKDTPEDQAFVAKMVEGYQHMAEFTKRFITALTLASSDPASNKKPISTDLLNVVV
ncbi:MAG: hypothetical protein AB7E49_10190 [Campylobacterales bacterium]